MDAKPLSGAHHPGFPPVSGLGKIPAGREQKCVWVQVKHKAPNGGASKESSMVPLAV